MRQKMVFLSKKKKANKNYLKKSENKKNNNYKNSKKKNKGLRKRTKNKKGGAKSPLIASASTILSLIEHMDKELEFLNRDDSTVTYIQCRQCLTKSYKMMEKIEEYLKENQLMKDYAIELSTHMVLIPIFADEELGQDHSCSLLNSLTNIEEKVLTWEQLGLEEILTLIRLHYSLNCVQSLVSLRISSLIMFSMGET